MYLLLKLAFRNFFGAGSRSWLNVIVLSFSFVVIVYVHGLMKGWDHQAKTDMKNWEIGSGQLWHKSFDPYDPFSLNEAHAEIPASFNFALEQGSIIPILITPGTIFPEGRLVSVLIKGIPADQKFLQLPTSSLDTLIDVIPAIIGKNMAHTANLKLGDQFTMRWRNKHGTFDAADIEIVDIFQCNVPGIDYGQVWINLNQLQEMTLLNHQATLFTFNEKFDFPSMNDSWKLMTFNDLVADLEDMIQTKSKGQSIFYFILLLLAMLAIFDTQVLSIFRRQKEIGTYIALGYTKQRVVWLFTAEGAINSIFAALLAAVYGGPVLWWQSIHGLSFPMDTQEFGIAIADTIYPLFTIGLVVSTILIVLLTTTIVSYIPSRKIASMNPTEALKGRVQ
jgi:putative ABC transport system permease protein